MNNNELEAILQEIDEKGIYPLPIFKLFFKRELKMAFRFRYPLCFMVVNIEGGDTSTKENFIDLLNNNIRKNIDICSEFVDENSCYLLCPYSNLPVSFIIAERIKLIVEAQLGEKVTVKIAGVEIEETDVDVTIDEAIKYSLKTLDIVKQKKGSGALIYSIKDLKEEV